MIDPFLRLGLRADADARSIKRAYARCLRETRPDEDPAGFQALHEAYREALALASAASSEAPGRAPDRPVGDGQPVALATLTEKGRPEEGWDVAWHAPRVWLDPGGDAGKPEAAAGHMPIAGVPEPFNARAFLADYRCHVASGDEDMLAAWLAEYPAFWHLPAKQDAGLHLLDALFREPAPISPGCFHATLAFFHLDDALSGADAMDLRRTRFRCVGLWLVRKENRDQLAEWALGCSNRAAMKRVEAALKHSRGPRCWWRDLPVTLRPNHFTRDMAAVLQTLCGGILDDLPAGLDREHARFWLDAGAKELGATRLRVRLFRSVANTLLIPLALALVIASIPGINEEASWLQRFGVAGLVLVIWAAAITALCWVPVGIGWLSGKLGLLVERLPLPRWLRHATTPAFCGAALLLTAWVDPVIGTWVSFVVLAVAVLRYRRRYHPGAGSSPAGIGMIATVLVVSQILLLISQQLQLSIDLSPLWLVLAINCVTLAVWARDLYRRGIWQAR